MTDPVLSQLAKELRATKASTPSVRTGVCLSGTSRSSGVVTVALDNDPASTPVSAVSVAGALQTGARVALLVYPPRGLLVLGQIGGLPGVDVGFAGDNSQLSVVNFGLTSSFQTRGTFTITCPPQANFVSIFATAQCSAVNNSGANDALRIICDINGTGGGEQIQWVGTGTGGYPGSVFASNNHTSAATPGQTFVCNARVRTDVGTWTANAANIANVHVNAIFRAQ